VIQSGHHPIADHRPLELREYTQHPKQRPAGWHRSVERMLVQVEIDIAGSQFTQQAGLDRTTTDPTGTGISMATLRYCDTPSNSRQNRPMRIGLAVLNSQS
jgi:hypothetical protein